MLDLELHKAFLGDGDFVLDRALYCRSVDKVIVSFGYGGFEEIDSETLPNFFTIV
jgi:hypothetical protein